MKFDLVFPTPLMNAAGSLGFAPDMRRMSSLGELGAFVTNPVSLSPRSPAQSRGLIAFSGGFLLHSGYPNPGLKAVIRRYALRWARADMPVIVHLLAQGEDEISSMVSRLENVDGVSAVEIGLPPDTSKELAIRLIQAGIGELPVIARLPLERAQELAELVSQAGTAAVSLSPPRGAIPAPDGGLLRGRLYGPAIYPQALLVVQALARSGIPVIGGGGVYRHADAEAMLSAGALAVQLDSVLWRGWK